MAESERLSAEDRTLLERARELGRRGWGRPHPNPLVGCVLAKDGEVVGEGFHEVYGGPHAEIVALDRAGASAEGSTAYVSLEPCAHQGRTGPCAEALLGAGVRRVVYGAREPGPLAGGGGERLRAAGLDVIGPVWSEREARAENPAFFHTTLNESPFVALKLAITLDAKLAAAPGHRTRITGPEAEREVHRLRTGFDAVLVGAGTWRADDPRLTPRLVAPVRGAPRRLLLDTRAGLPSDAAVFEDSPSAPVHVFVAEDAPEADMERLEAAGAHVHPVSAAREGVDLGEVLSVSWEMGVRSILCEGGARLAGSLLREGRAHRLYLFVAPTTLGEGGVPAFPDGPDSIDWSPYELTGAPEAFGRDALLVYDRAEI